MQMLSPFRGVVRGPVAHSTRRDITRPPTDEETGETYKARTDRLGKMYAGTAEWGTPIARNVIDVRAAFTLAGGVRPVLRETVKESTSGATRELEFIKAFVDYNGLRDDLPQDWAKEAEIEGKFLATLKADLQAGQIKARYFSYSSRAYTVIADPDDYAVFLRVEYTDSAGNPREILPEYFVYRPFGGRTHNVNETPSKASSVVWNFEALHKSLYDWRKANRLFASPTPYFKCANPAEVNALLDALNSMKWKIGQFLAGTAEYNLVGMPTTGIDSLQKEITTNIQLISGNTGVPVHFLGFPELMSNRSTADTLFDMVAASTHRERRIWMSFYTELFDRAIALANAGFQAGLRPGLVEAQIPEVSSKTMFELKDNWLPLFESGVLSLETLLAKIPDLDDPRAELQRIQQAAGEAAANALEVMRARAVGGADPHEEVES